MEERGIAQGLIASELRRGGSSLPNIAWKHGPVSNKKEVIMALYGVYSEVGRLRTVLVHRPDLSLKRLTPSNYHELLFDDVL